MIKPLEMKINDQEIDLFRIDNLREVLQNRVATVCSQRALAYTKAFKENEEDSYILKKSKGFKETLESMTLYLLDDSLFFGNQASRLFSAPVFPEYSIDWIIEEMDTFEKRSGDVFICDDKTKEELRSIHSYWSKNTHQDAVNQNFSELVCLAEKQKVLHKGGISNSGDGHIVSDHAWILEIGYDGMIELINQKLQSKSLTSKQIDFYHATKISLEAALTYCDRFYQLIEQEILVCKDNKRKIELKEMSKLSRKVLRGKAESFYEGLQAIYLNHVFQMIESNGHSFCYGRFDQYTYNLFKKDQLSDERALELITHFFMMNNTLNKLRSNSHTTFSQGYPLYTNLMIGGYTPKGVDGTNELSYLSIEAMNLCRLNEPNFSMRYNKDTPRQLLRLAAKLIRTGCGMPSLFNDHVCVKGLIDLGILQEDALDYVAIGCVETGVQGKYGHRATGMTYVNWGKVLEIVLHQGKEPNSGIQLFEFDEFRNYDDLVNGWEKALKFYSDLAVESDQVCDKSLEKFDASPLGSIFIHNALELGKTLKEGGCQYDVISQSNIGSSVVGNSLAAIKECVFEKKLFTMSDLLLAMKDNWKSEESQKIHNLLKESPKFGNDDDTVDFIVKDVFDSYLKLLPDYSTVRKQRGPQVSCYTMSTSNITSYIPNGKAVGATPDGRYAHDPLNEGCSPTQATDVSGPIALINSVSKLPNDKVAAGQLLNMRWSPSTLQGEENLEKFVDFLRASLYKGIYHNQFNVVDNKVLREAQKYPEKHKDLIVRVAGYCAQFVTLMPEAQEAIINRTQVI